MRGLSPVAPSGGHSSSRCADLSLSRPLPLRSTGSRRAGSVVVAHGLSCSVARGILPDQGSNPCPLHWQADSQPLCHQGSPFLNFKNINKQIYKIETLRDFSALLAILIQRYIQELQFSNQNLAKKNLFLVVKCQVTPSAESHFADDDYRETTITESLLCARHCTGYFPYVIKNHYYGAWTMSLDTVLLHWICVSKRVLQLPTLPGSPGCCEANK